MKESHILVFETDNSSKEYENRYMLEKDASLLDTWIHEFPEFSSHLHYGFVEMDAEGKVSFANVFAHQLLGKKFNNDAELYFEEALQKQIRDIQDKIVFQQLIHNIVSSVTLSYVHPLGEVLFLQFQRLDCEERNRTLFIIKDMSIYKDAEKQLYESEKAISKAKDAERSFLENMRHELRTPLSNIIGMSQLLRGTDMNEEQLRFLDNLYVSAEILNNTINDIFELKKLQNNEVKVNNSSFNLKGMLEELLFLYSKKASGKNLDFNLKYPDTALGSHIYCDRQMLHQSLNNLLSNAEKYTDEGLVELEVTCLRCEDEQIKVRFTVRDTGIGIPKEKQSEILEQFKLSESIATKTRDGVGLGLAIASQAIKLLGSEIHLVSILNEGTSVSFELDLEPIPDGQKPMAIDIEKSLFDKKAHVLVVEDNRLNQYYVTTLLDRIGFTYDIAENGKLAVEFCQENVYELVLMDLHMPVMGGVEASIEILKSKLNRTTPVLAFSASDVDSKTELAEKYGMKDFLRKPFTPNLFYEILLKHLEHAAFNVSDLQNEVEPFEFKDLLNSMQLMEYFGSDYIYTLKYIQAFLETIPGDFEKLRTALSEDNLDEVYLMAHKIKPTFQMLGIEPMSTMLQRICSIYTNNNNLTEIQEIGSSIMAQIDDILKRLRSEMERLAIYCEAL